MQNPLFSIPCLAAALLLAGCTSPPPPPVLEEPQTQSAPFTDATGRLAETGGMVAVGVGKSKSLELARNRAIVNSRLNLQKTLDEKMRALRQEFIEESGALQNTQAPDVFETAAQAVKEQIQTSEAKELTHEITDGTVTAYALIELSPEIIMTRLAKEETFYTRFRETKAFESLEQDIQTYEMYKLAQPGEPAEQ